MTLVQIVVKYLLEECLAIVSVDLGMFLSRRILVKLAIRIRQVLRSKVVIIFDDDPVSATFYVVFVVIRFL